MSLDRVRYFPNGLNHVASARVADTGQLVYSTSACGTAPPHRPYRVDRKHPSSKNRLHLKYIREIRLGISKGHVYCMVGWDVAQEMEAAPKQSHVRQSNQLFISFYPFPVRHPIQPRNSTDMQEKAKASGCMNSCPQPEEARRRNSRDLAFIFSCMSVHARAILSAGSRNLRPAC